MSKVCTSPFKMLVCFNINSQNTCHNVKLLAYFTIIWPKFRICLRVLDPQNPFIIISLEQIWREVVRFLHSPCTFESPSGLKSSNNIPPLEARRKKLWLQLLYRIIDKKLLLHPSPYVTPPATRHTRCHRQYTLSPHLVRNDSFKYSFFPRTKTRRFCRFHTCYG